MATTELPQGTELNEGAQEASFDDPAILKSLLNAAYGQILLILDLLERELKVNVTTDPKFSAVNNLTAAYLLWKMQDPSFFQMLDLILRDDRARNSFAACGQQ